MSTPSLRKDIHARGGTVSDTRDGIRVDFPETDQSSEVTPADAKEVETAVDRAKESRINVVRLFRERGQGWYAAESRETHPGFWWVLQIDELIGQPERCECPASHVCWHLGAAVAEWRLRHGYEANGAAALTAWEATLERTRANRASEPIEEVWCD